MLAISPYPALIYLKDYLDDIIHCVTVVGKWIFTVILLLHFLPKKTIWSTFALMIIKRKEINGYKGALKSIRLLTQDNTKSVIQKLK